MLSAYAITARTPVLGSLDSLSNYSEGLEYVKGISDDAYEKSAAISFVILCVNVNKLYNELVFSIFN